MAIDKSILFTRAITQEQIQKLKNEGWEVDCIDFIAFSYNFEQELLANCFEQNDNAYIFSSKNAVKALIESGFADKLKGKTVFCVGEGTSAALEAKGIKVNIPPKANAYSLSRFIVNEFPEIERFTFFCGNLRRDEMPNYLQEKGKTLKEFTLYQTHLLEKEIDRKYTYIVFYSPSAVRAFFSKNSSENAEKCITIGTTTATELEEYYKGKIEVAEEADTDSILKLVLN